MRWIEIWKRKSFRILVFLQVCLLLIGILGLFSPIKTIEVESGQENIFLKAGVYKVIICYRASEDGNQLQVYDTTAEGENQSVQFGVVNLYSGENIEECEMWVLRKTDTIKAEVVYGGQGELEIHSLSIVSTNKGSRIFLFFVCLGSCCINILYLLRFYNEKEAISRERKIIWAILTAALLLVSVPSMVNYNLWGDDWGFHLLRVEGLISGLKDGQFPVRIQGNWLRGYGYAVSIFYSDCFMIVPMFFRLIGFSVNTSCRMFAVTINAAALLLSYYCFSKVFRDRIAGCTAALLYIFSSYRIHNLYMRSAIGESLAMIFLPLVFYGFYRIFTEEIYSKEYQKSWLPLTLGLTGIIQSHVLTCEMLAFCILLLCIICIKKVLQKQTFWVLTKTVIITFCLNLWYLVPFADYMITGKFNVGHAETMTIKTPQDWAIYPTHLLFFFWGQGKQGKIEGIGMEQTGAFSVGTALIIVFFVWLFLEWTGKLKNKFDSYKKLGRLAFLYTCLFFVISSCYFPWNEIQNLGGIAEMLTLSLQFPYRFLSLACLSTSVLAGVVMVYWKEYYSLKICQSWAVLLIAVAVFFNMYQNNMLLITRGFARVYNKQSMGTTYVSNGEYLPYGADVDAMVCDLLQAGENVSITAYKKGQDTLHTNLSVVNYDKEKEGYIELPLLYYKGYAAKDKDTGQYLEVTEGENSVVKVLLPADYSGSFLVWFKSPWYWRLSEGISFLTAFAVIGCCIKSKRDRNNEILGKTLNKN